MAKRRSKEQLKADRIIKAQLMKLGDIVLEEAVPASRRDTGRLQDEMNWRVEKDTQLVFSQMFYGQFNFPANKDSGDKNALKITIDKHVGDTTTAIIRDINSVLLQDFKTK